MKSISRFWTFGELFIRPVVLVILAAVIVPRLAAAQTSDLWRVVHNICMPNQEMLGHPWPCEEIHLASGVESGYAVVPDWDKANKTQVVVTPTVQVAGIESPSLLAAGSPNYWQAAWQARSYVEQKAGRAIRRDDLGLAINSMDGRTDAQLHIHVDCLRSDVGFQLARHQSQIKTAWSTFGLSFDGHHYFVMKLVGNTLEEANPFRLLATLPSARLGIGHETLVVAGAIFDNRAPGFYLLASRANINTGNLGHGEELLDHRCSVLSRR